MSAHSFDHPQRTFHEKKGPVNTPRENRSKKGREKMGQFRLVVKEKRKRKEVLNTDLGKGKAGEGGLLTHRDRKAGCSLLARANKKNS